MAQNDSLEEIATVRQFKDRVYDYIPIYPRTCAFIDTKQFQRLRYVKQLGTAYFVWPGASHNRFEHCLGVAYLARRMVEHLQTSQPELDISDRDVECVEIAGLCHDLGHGPFSHVWDNHFIPQALKGKKWKHEDASEMMFDDLVAKNDIDIPERDIKFVKALIAGDVNRCNDPPEKPFLFEIVANKRNGIDVDKFDYIARDSTATGEGTSICLMRLINSARVIENQICYNIKDANTLYEMCHTRFSLHKLIYSHKTARAIEYMLVDALLAAEPHLHFAELVDKPDKYINLCDNIIQRIEMSEDPNLETSQSILSRITTRDLYKCVDYKTLPWVYRENLRDFCTPEIIVKAAKAYLPTTDAERKLVEELEPKHVIVDEALLHYGMGQDNPLDKIKFYSKNKPRVCYHAAPGDLSTLIPDVFGEVLLRIYTREARFFGIIQHGFRTGVCDVLSTAPAEPSSTETSSNSVTSSPQTTQQTEPNIPRTRPFSRVTSKTFGTTTFSNNNFTSVDPAFHPPSPTKDRKRGREIKPDSPNKKKRSI